MEKGNIPQGRTMEKVTFPGEEPWKKGEWSNSIRRMAKLKMRQNPRNKSLASKTSESRKFSAAARFPKQNN
jgi:hypothetical protein